MQLPPTIAAALALLVLGNPVHAQSCFESALDSSVGSGPLYLQYADLDGDGDLDIVFKLQYLGQAVALNQGGGTFSAPVIYPYGLNAAIGDLNGDGLPDLVVSGWRVAGDYLGVLFNQGGGTFAAPVIYSGPSGWITLADFDGDGDLDAAVFGQGLLSVYINQGGGVFSSTLSIPDSIKSAIITTADVDGDGDVDIVHASSFETQEHVDVFLNPGNGAFTSATTCNVGSMLRSIALGDFNNDGLVDLATAHDQGWPYTAGTIELRFGTGGGLFGAPQVYNAGLNPRSLACGDFDGDGDLDLAVTNYFGHTITVFLNQGSGSFVNSGSYDTGSMPNSLVCADFDGDGDADLATTDYVGDAVSVLLNCTAHWSRFCPGDGSTGACPCANSGLAGHGCENAAGTGGAQLVAAGGASLAHDTLELTTTGELDFVTSVVLQGSAAIAPTPFGDGLRCVGGALKRLYIEDAFGGIVIVPEAGDPSISLRSAALGDTIAPGTTRYYQVYYRDPNSSFCPSPQGNNWNVSSGVSVLWVQ